MKNKLLLIVTAFTILCFANIVSAQAPAMGAAANFVLFSSNGAITNTGITHLTGNVGTNAGSSIGFGNVDGVMHDGDGMSASASADLLTAYGQLNSAIPTFFPAPLLGNGATLVPGVYSITGASTLNLDLTLNGQGDENAVFVFQIQGAFSTGPSSQIILTNGTKACNVFWKIEGMVSMAAGTKMKGTVIANNSAIEMNTGVTLEGRALSTTGAITVDGILGNTPIGCGSPLLTGPVAPVLGSAACYALFSANGELTNGGVTFATGDLGTNVGLTTGYDPLNVTGTIHPIPDVSTAACAADLGNAYTYMNLQPFDIELLYPALFGNNLVLTPHTYLLNAATIFTDTLFLNAQGNADAVFILKINGALLTSTYSKVILINGAKAVNVFWMVEGAVEINDYSDFKGTVICNNGAFTVIGGTRVDGRVLLTNGALNTSAITATMPPGCDNPVGINPLAKPGKTQFATLSPNPMTTLLVVTLNDASGIYRSELRIFNALGTLVITANLTQKITSLDTNLSSGVYFYQVIGNNRTTQSGRLVSKQ